MTSHDLPALLARVKAASGPDPQLDGMLDGLVGNEGEAWPAMYTSNVLSLQSITSRVGLDIGVISSETLRLMNSRPSRPLALLYAEALLSALIAQTESKP